MTIRDYSSRLSRTLASLRVRMFFEYEPTALRGFSCKHPAEPGFLIATIHDNNFTKEKRLVVVRIRPMNRRDRFSNTIDNVVRIVARTLMFRKTT